LTDNWEGKYEKKKRVQNPKTLIYKLYLFIFFFDVNPIVL